MNQSVGQDEFETSDMAFSEKTDIKQKKSGQILRVRAGEHAMFETVSETWLSWEAGTPALSVSTIGKEQRELNATNDLRLDAGERFSLSTADGIAAVLVSAEKLPRRLLSGDLCKMAQVTALYDVRYEETEPGTTESADGQNMYTLLYVDMGAVCVTVEGTEHLLEQGELLICRKNQGYSFRVEGDETAKTVTVNFDAEEVKPERLCMGRMCLNGKGKGILQEMLWEQENRAAYGGEVQLTLLQMLLLMLLRDEQERMRTEYRLSSENQVIRQAQQFVSEHVMEKISVPRVAQYIHVSPSYLTALFQRYLQISPGEYIRRAKLQKSKQMIRKGNLNFTQIAKELDYSTIYHFSRQFKQTFGMSPSEYAKTVK